ncbi:isoprenoid synthase domain-containing protein [Crucibulum laeve]|uniref:Isoprenoid synthase domain-containing protein n=1 Tax=Crucibulum laeve TaxID=68775 RepID=A0A5C3LS21_9AGAR|nr:isoprenoid synthase domain-containing protein [Crucibulum laeve]
MAPILSTVINTSHVPSYFSYLPVRIHNDAAAIDEATLHAIETCAPVGSKERSQAIYRHSNPHGNPYALCHGECDIEKLKFFVKVVELIWIDDDVTEELPHAEALNDHEILRQGLHREFDSNPDTGKTVGVKKQYMREAREGMLALDPKDTPALLDTLDKYLKEYDNSDEKFKTIEEYLPYRIPNAGYRVCSHFTRWAMDIHLTKEEFEAVHEFEWALGGVLALTNDYFSWRKEKFQFTDRVRNAVPLLMNQYKLGQDQARLLLKGIIVDEEERAKRLRMELEARPNLSSDMKRYIEALELYSGGNCYWSATCPRYNKPQEECGEI